MLRVTDVKDGRIDATKLYNISHELDTEFQRTKLRGGEVVISIQGSVGRVGVVPPELAGANVSRTLAVIRLKDPSMATWVHRALETPGAQEAMRQLTGGTTRDSLNLRDLRVIDLPIAPESARQSILASVSSGLSLIESSTNHVGAARLAIGRFRQAVLAEACSGRLTADWRRSHPPLHSAQELIEESRGRATAQALDRDEWTSPTWLDLPTSWVWARVRELANVRGGIQKQPKRAPISNTYPYLRVANVQRGSLNLSEMHDFELFDDELATYRLEAGDLLVVEGNGSPNEIGRAALWHGEISDCVHQNHIIRVRPVGMSSAFLELFWNSPVAAQEIASLAVTSAGLYSLSTKKIGDVPIPVPPLEEQYEIAQRVHELLGVADVLVERIGKALKSVSRSSEAILAKAFRGELAATDG
jgi:type I restriction enzyme S subunit